MSWHGVVKLEKFTQKHHLVDGEVYTRYDVHNFTMGDVDDPDIYAAGPIYEWQKTDKGKWVMEHCMDPTYHIHADPTIFGFRISISAYMTGKRYTEFALKFL